MYDASADPRNLDLLKFAQEKLLCVDDIVTGLSSYSSERGCAVLSQRLALDINSTGYITSGFTKNYAVAEQAQVQIANHMRVCVAIPEDLVAVYGIASSEPILSEAASVIMRDYSNFDLSSALMNVLDSYAISPGDRGELLVAAFFTRARDLHVKQMSRRQFFPITSRLCPVFSVVDLLSKLFDEGVFRTMLDSPPSVCRMGISSPEKFGDVFRRTKMHFNHVIKPSQQNVISRQYLLHIMARGAAALGANCQPGYDMVYPFLFETNSLDIKNVGFVIVQVKNHARSIARNSKFFRKMDPFDCDLFSKDDSDFTVPIIRIVFSLGGKRPSLKRMQYKSMSGREGASSLEDGQPRFTSYDFWCSGIAPGLLQAVDESGARTRWEGMLQKRNLSEGMFLTSKDPDLRRSEHPGGGSNRGHYDSWLPESEIPPDESESESQSDEE